MNMLLKNLVSVALIAASPVVAHTRVWVRSRVCIRLDLV